MRTNFHAPIRRTLLLVAATVSSFAQTPDIAAANMRIGGLSYPRVAIDFQGTTAKLTAAPKRIVVLSDHIAEYLYQFLPGERIVGINKGAFEEFSSVQDKVNKYHPKVVKDAKSILELKPDLVLTSDSMSTNASAELQVAKVPVFSIQTTPPTLDQIAANIVVLGYVTGADEAAKKELDRYQGEIEYARQRCKEPHGEPRIYAVSMTGFSYGDQTLFQDIMKVVRGTNLAAQNGMHTYERLDIATVVKWNPDWVFTWALPGKKDQELRKWTQDDPGLRSISASRNHRVFVLESREVLPLSPLTTTFIRKIAEATCPAGK